MNLWEVATELSQRLIQIFLQDASGHRPVYGDRSKFQTDPHWRNLILFHEYFHGDNGAGLGASHQTGWTGLVAKLIQQCGEHCGQNNAPKPTEKQVELQPTRSAILDKMQEYLDSGLRLGWLIGPKSKRVEIYRFGQQVEVLQSRGEMSSGPESYVKNLMTHFQGHSQ